MLESFYKYIVDELIVGYFKENPVQPGSRYYVIIENQSYREQLQAAIESSLYSRNIELNGLFPNRQLDVKEDSYSTQEIMPDKSGHPLVIGYSDTAKDDYLNMLRNTVGVEGSKLQDYGIIFILSSNNMESLTTASTDLESPSYPLNTTEIRRNIKNKIDSSIVIDNERIYLKTYLNRLSQSIEDGACTLFDFDDILEVLQKKTIRNSFGQLGFFKDDTIYDVFFKKTEDQVAERARENADFYETVQSILNNNDERKDKIEKLSTYVDKKTAEHIVNEGDVESVSFDEISIAINKKKQTINLAVEEINLREKDAGISYIERETGSKRHPHYFIIICDTKNIAVANLRFKFNKEIKDLLKDKDNCEYTGQYLTIKVVSGCINKTLEDTNSQVDISVIKLSVAETILNDIRSLFTLRKNGSIVIDVPEDQTEVVIGHGANTVKYSELDPLVWKDDYSLHIPASIENDGRTFKVMFGVTLATFILNINTDKVRPVSPLAIFEMIWTKHLTFHNVARSGLDVAEFSKIMSDDINEEYSIYDYFRKHLVLEHRLISERAYWMLYRPAGIDGFDSSDDVDFEKEDLDLPEAVKNSLDAIYDYFTDKKTVPSLTYVDDELESLYSTYLNTVYSCITDFNGDDMAGTKEYNITRLGLIVSREHIGLSPFHPINIAFILQFKHSFDAEHYDLKLLKLVTPYNAIPYLSFNGNYFKPFSNSFTDGIKTWLYYDSVKNNKQIRSNTITTSMVCDKMGKFIKYFDYLFRDKDCPLIVNIVGIEDDIYIIKGVLEFIKEQLKDGQVQRVSLHEYVDNILTESFYEKLNRLNSDDKIFRELDKIDFKTGANDEETDVVRQLFTRVTFYKHELKETVQYSHLTFFEFNTGSDFINPNTKSLRLEMSFNGLVSSVSTLKKGNTYQIGFGAKGLKPLGWIYRTAIAMNTLYANEKDDGTNHFVSDTCIAKKFDFNSSELLDSIYDNSNWVTFLNPEVDIDFFYKQKDLYIIHYMDQYSINAKYDSITVTKHIRQYENMLKAPYEKYSLPNSDFEHFNKIMLAYFNCLNGNWLLSVINKSEFQIREKMSLVASCIILRQFMKRAKGIIWIPISLDEILRVTGSIGLPMDSLFSKKSLGIKGSLSDDLLMIGLDDSDCDHVKLFYYPVEVKYSKTGCVLKNGEEQVVKTYNAFRDNIMRSSGFRRNVYSTFFVSQFLTNADKLKANELLTQDEMARIENCRYDLLNLKYIVEEHVPEEELGHAAIIYFTEDAQRQLYLRKIDDIPVCHIHLSEKECYQCVANPTDELKAFVNEKDVFELTDGDDSSNQINNTSSPDLFEAAGPAVNLNGHRNSNGPTHKDINSPSKDVYTTDSTNNDKSKDRPIKLIVGYSNSTHEEVCFEPNDTQKVTHPNMGIIGTMGTGKTQFARSIIAQLSKEGNHNVGQRPIGILVFDYKGDYKDKDFLDKVNGKCYKSSFPFNPFKLVVTTGLEGMNLPAITADTISDSFAKAYGLGVKQQSHIKDVIKSAYEECGITRDSSTWSKPAPTLNDVITSYFEEYDANDSVYALFSKLQDYSIFTDDNSNCVSMFEWLQGVRVIDLTLFPDDTKRVIVSMILDLFYSEMKKLGASKTSGKYREIRAMIMVDEAHQFLSKEFNSLRKIISEGRMFGVGMILSTQNLSDFKAAHEDYSQYILSWAIHHVNSITRSEIASIFGASDSHWQTYMNFINKAHAFQSICKLGNRVEGIKDLPYYELIQKDPRF